VNRGKVIGLELFGFEDIYANDVSELHGFRKRRMIRRSEVFFEPNDVHGTLGVDAGV
jgi:hypothetical protein